MALVVKDRVKEITTTTGTSNLTLGGAVYGFQSFSVIGNGNTTYYGIYDSATGDWEVGVGTYSTTGPTLTRDTVLESSNSGSKVVFGAGTKDVFVTYPAERSVYLDAAGSAVTVLDVGTLGVSTANISTANITAGTISTTPTSSNDLVNKTYVDAIAAQGISYHTPVKYEVPDTTGNLTATYNNGASGVGATLTNAGTQTAFTPDGVVAQVGDRILVYNQTNAAQNGVYQVTTVGSGSTNWVLTRTSDANTYGVKDPNALGAGDAFYVTSGNTGAGETYVCNTAGTITFGTTAITFAQISSAQVYSAGAGLTLSNLQFSITPVGTASTYGSSSSVPVFTTNAYGQVTSVTNTGIAISAGAVSGLAPSATTDTTNASNITSGTLGSARLTGSYTGITGVGTLTAGTWNASTIGAAYGGTGITSYTVGDILYADGSTSLAKLADVATGNALLSGGVGTAPAWGKVGLQTHVSGTLQVTNGGTGATTLTGYVYGNGTGAFTASTSIPNSVTTATSANTASAIVARDGSGNFSAGTITASLSGNASTATSATSATTATNLAGGTAGAIPYQSGSGTTLFSAAGTSGQYLQSNGTSAPSWSTLPTVGDGTLTLNTSGTGLSGSASFTANQSGNTTFTVTSNATSGNTGSTIVARDGSGNFSAGTITATLSGNASTATTATTATNWGSYGAVPAAGTSFGNANTIGRSDGSGYTYFYYINSSTSNSENPSVSQVIVTNGGDNFYRKASIAHLTSSLSGTAPINISGNAVNLSTTRSNWSTNGTISAVVGQLAWKNYGNNHTIFDASNSTSPDGTAVNNTNAAVAWTGSYPTLMGWNGASTYGVRVDSARVADSAGSAGSVDYNNLTNKTGGTGTYTTSGDYRAPIFYDSNDTAYYADPASTSSLSTVLVGYNSASPYVYAVASTGSLTFGTTSDTANYSIKTVLENYNGNHSKLSLYWYTGIRYYASNYYGGHRFYDIDGTQYLSIGSGASQQGVIANYNMQAPIFYDSNDTNYYVDPNSNSRLVNLGLGGVTPDVRLSVSGDGHISSYLYLGGTAGSSGSWSARMYSSGGATYINTNTFEVNRVGYGGSAVFSTDTSGNTFSATSSRAPIFYDSNDTTYYIDPNGTSYTYTLGSFYLKNNYDVSTDHPYGIYFGSNVSTSYAIYRESGSWAYPYPDLRIAFHTGIKIGANASYEGVRFYTDYDMSSQVMSVNNVNDGLGGGNVYVNNSLVAGSSLRAPIFYDSNNTGYYVDPASTSNLNNTQIVTLGVGTAASGTTGEIRATNNITAYYSDDRLKTKLGRIENALARLLTLEGFYYHANETAQALGYEPVREVGVSAQSVQQVLPEVVVPAPIDAQYLTVRYEKLIPLLIEAVKELSAKVDALK